MAFSEKQARKVRREEMDSNSTAVIGLGNPARGDDAVGIEVARRLRGLAPERIFLETDGLEGIILSILDRKDIRVGLFVDAVDFEGRPGEIRIFSEEAFPASAISTHKVPLRLLSALLRKEGKASYLLGIQPNTLDFDSGISDDVMRSFEEVVQILGTFLGRPTAKQQRGKPKQTSNIRNCVNAKFSSTVSLPNNQAWDKS